MMERVETASREFFEHMYQQSQDPWNFARDLYELSRYQAIVRAMGDRRYSRAYEPGCSVGVLTEMLAHRCEAVLATDIAEAAVERARERCIAYPNVRVEQGAVADVDPGEVDLLILSEIGYYSSLPELRVWTERLLGDVLPGGVIVAAHWLGSSADHAISGDQVHGILGELARHRSFAQTHCQRHDRFRLDAWIRTR